MTRGGGGGRRGNRARAPCWKPYFWKFALEIIISKHLQRTVSHHTPTCCEASPRPRDIHSGFGEVVYGGKNTSRPDAAGTTRITVCEPRQNYTTCRIVLPPLFSPQPPTHSIENLCFFFFFSPFRWRKLTVANFGHFFVIRLISYFSELISSRTVVTPMVV